MKRSLPSVEAGALRLRLIEESDLHDTLSWRNRDEARVWFKTSTPLTYEQHANWFHQRYLRSDTDFLFVVETEGVLVGQASVYGIDWQARTAEVGRFLVDSTQAGRGYISRACGVLLDICWHTLDLDYVFLEVIDTNARAIHLYRKHGFSEEEHYDGLIRMGLRKNQARTE
ncbi:GNAT family N-acetyltransferase [Pseudomonas sp. TNT2022 ID642]|uniref:GNAT family N-acetyltransferase n=1 Tax=Pseudomonas sp. TNT2022 ID642 TaxID=2942632 RepID=UPI0023630007|nr:GNAT family N-acetyltransferase [Pseudomonas sp. TNT2022 ID642]MDD1005317.1 GNAT family N-acetyltransferase [Pseudomonas sp. TNT2022 ID642]